MAIVKSDDRTPNTCVHGLDCGSNWIKRERKPNLVGLAGVAHVHKVVEPCLLGE